MNDPKAQSKLLSIFGLIGLIAAAIFATKAFAPGSPQLQNLHLPPGFHIELYASVPGARQMALSKAGNLFVGTKDSLGNVYAVTESGGARLVKKIASGLYMPNGVAMRDNALYVAEVNRVTRFDDIDAHLDAPPKAVVVNDTLPRDGHHGWKYIRFGPDGLLYVPIGAPCNVCVTDSPYAGLLRMHPDGTGLESYATGIRNTVGLDWSPDKKELWFTDNGRDLLGDNLPPDELNCAPSKGMNFGFPFRYGDNVPDPQFGMKAKEGVEFTAPAQDLHPHAAALGMCFYTGKMFPPEYRNQIFICEHGSWNSSVKVGYRVMMVTLKDGKAVSYKPFLDGFCKDDGDVSGRPVDLNIMPDGSMLISDDYSGSIYRITYDKSAR